MDADQFMALEQDGFRYELIDGIVRMSPSANFHHQDIAGEIEYQIRRYLEKHPVGYVGHEIDVPFAKRLVYNPDLVFVSKARMPKRTEKVGVVPDVVVEVLSRKTRKQDMTRKLGDYQRFGVMEYWVIDPREVSCAFYRLRDGQYVSVAAKRGKFASLAIPGFVLDVAKVERCITG